METDSEEISSGNLRTSCAKLRGMAYLIELCGNLPATPLDLVMTDIHDEILDFARAIERQEIKREQAKGRKDHKKKIK